MARSLQSRFRAALTAGDATNQPDANAVRDLAVKLVGQFNAKCERHEPLRQQHQADQQHRTDDEPLHNHAAPHHAIAKR